MGMFGNDGFFAGIYNTAKNVAQSALSIFSSVEGTTYHITPDNAVIAPIESKVDGILAKTEKSIRAATGRSISGGVSDAIADFFSRNWLWLAVGGVAVFWLFKKR